MKTLGRNRALHGALAAIVASWLALRAMLWVSALIFQFVAPAPIKNESLAVGLVIAMWLTSLPLLGWVLGLVCTYFWQNTAGVATQKRWGWWTLLPAFAIVGCSVVCALPLAAWPFFKAVEFGARWWPTRPHRRYFGFANEWEREEK